MFIDKEWKKETSKIPYSEEEEKKKNYLMYFVVGIFLLAAFAVIFWFRKPIKQNLVEVISNGSNHSAEKASSTPGLPQDFGNGDNSQYEIGANIQSIKAEDLTFGHFYEKPANDFISTLVRYSLPLNVKTDVMNYYEVSRKIDLDPYVESLNNNGFAVIDAPTSLRNADFFSAYKYLLENDIPVSLTEDFLFYYYQNTLKQVFKEVEKNSFYENVWDINKKLYDISLARYKKSLSDYGAVNDPVTEAERMELAYFAVALKLLEPMKTQVNTSENFTDNKKFTAQESEEFSFEMPEYLKSDVDREVELIRKGSGQVKSPVLLFQRNYGDFSVPVNYKNNAKLNNFYLALKWLNTVFPLYYRDDNCPDCLLDKDDWVINMAAAAGIAKDFYENQDLKNQWAMIYKFISFFSGLRSDLTYLNYHTTYSEIFGNDYNLRSIFSRQNNNREKDLNTIRERLLQFKFSDLEGGLNREKEKSKLGMRILQEPYWPNNYLLSQLTGQDMMSTAEKKSNIVTACQERYAQYNYRCTGFAYDILNMVSPVSTNFDYFYNNTNYTNYNNRIEQLRREIALFDKFTWNNNVYWVTLDIGRNLLNTDRSGRPVYSMSNEWLVQREYNTFLGAWTNLHLPDDLFVSYYETQGSNLGSFRQCNKYNYVEPNIALYQDFVVRNNMLVKMLTMLQSDKRTNTAAAALKETNKKLAQAIEISKRELNNQVLTDEDCKFISDIIKQVIEEKGGRTFNLDFSNEATKRTLKESIEGIKLLAIIYEYNNQKVLVMGPIFNFREN